MATSFMIMAAREAIGQCKIVFEGKMVEFGNLLEKVLENDEVSNMKSWEASVAIY